MSVNRNTVKISNRPSGGGSKLQGLPKTANISAATAKALSAKGMKAAPNRNLIICMNQLGGIGRGRSQFGPSADGMGPCIQEEGEAELTNLQQHQKCHSDAQDAVDKLNTAHTDVVDKGTKSIEAVTTATSNNTDAATSVSNAGTLLGLAPLNSDQQTQYNNHQTDLATAKTNSLGAVTKSAAAVTAANTLKDDATTANAALGTAVACLKNTAAKFPVEAEVSVLLGSDSLFKPAKLTYASGDTEDAAIDLGGVTSREYHTGVGGTLDNDGYIKALDIHLQLATDKNVAIIATHGRVIQTHSEVLRLNDIIQALTIQDYIAPAGSFELSGKPFAIKLYNGGIWFKLSQSFFESSSFTDSRGNTVTIQANDKRLYGMGNLGDGELTIRNSQNVYGELGTIVTTAIPGHSQSYQMDWEYSLNSSDNTITLANIPNYDELLQLGTDWTQISENAGAGNLIDTGFSMVLVSADLTELATNPPSQRKAALTQMIYLYSDAAQSGDGLIFLQPQT